MKFSKKYKGFTLIELIAVMAVLVIIISVAVPKFSGQTKKAIQTRLINDSRVLEDACHRYYIDHGDWPRLSDEPLNEEDITEKIYYLSLDNPIEIEPEAKYYDIDFDAIKPYVNKISENKLNFILQNPVGSVYVLDPETNPRLPKNNNLVSGGSEGAGNENNTEDNNPGDTGNTGENGENNDEEGNSGSSGESTELSNGHFVVNSNYAAMFDGNFSTYYSLDNDITIPIEGNMKNRLIKIHNYSYASTQSMIYEYEILDKNYNFIPFMSKHETDPDYKWNNEKLTFKNKIFETSIIIPEGAAYLYMYSYYNGNKIYEIEVFDDIYYPEKITNLSATPGLHNIGLNWNNPNDEDFDKVVIFKNGEYLGESSTGYFNSDSLAPNTIHTYTLYAVDNTGNFSDVVSIVSQTEALPQNYLIPEGYESMFDNNYSTYVSPRTTVNLSIFGDMTNRIIKIYSTDHRIQYQIFDSYGNALTYKYKSGNSSSYSETSYINHNKEYLEIVIPTSASRIQISSAYSASKIYEIDQTETYYAQD